MKPARFVTTMAFASIAATCLALPNFVGVFQSTAKPPAGSALAKAGCKACHANGAALNPYGTDMKKAMAALKTKTLNAAVMKKLATLDSDKDGVKNAKEIKKGTLPGDPKSK